MKPHHVFILAFIVLLWITMFGFYLSFTLNKGKSCCCCMYKDGKTYYSVPL